MNAHCIDFLIIPVCVHANHMQSLYEAESSMLMVHELCSLNFNL